jgi:hypothetical protein
MQTPDSTPEPTCEKCRAHGRIEIDETARLRVEVLTKYDQVITKLGSPVQTDVTHAISALGLRFHYRIERPIRCALPDRTNHNEGLIVETACGLVLNIGHVCGDKWIFGLSKLVEMRTRTDAYDSDIRTIDHNPAELRAELGALEQAETHLHAARGGLVDFVRPVSRYMRDATTNAKLLEVLIDVQEKGLDGRTRIDQISHRLEGVELWGDRPVPSAETLRSRLDALDEEIRVERAKDPELNDVHASLARRIRAIKRDSGPLLNWVVSAGNFFSDANLHAVLYVTKTQATVEGHGFVIVDEGVRKRISADGVTNLQN